MFKIFRKSKKKNAEDTTKQIIDFAVEEYRFLKSYSSLLNKILPEERQKYKATYDFHIKKIQEIMEECKLKIVELENKEFNDGLSIIALNMEDFNKEDKLIIQQVIEPLIISTIDGTIMKSGTVILEKKNEDEGEN